MGFLMGLYGDFMGYKVIYEIYIYLFKYPNQSDAWLRLKMEDLLPQMAILGGNIWLQNRWMAWGTLFSDKPIYVNKTKSGYTPINLWMFTITRTFFSTRKIG
jgi:hypothetical protein